MTPQTSVNGSLDVRSKLQSHPNPSRRRVLATAFTLPMAALSGHLFRAIPVAAAPIPIGTDVVVATDRLNLRVGPGLSRTVLRVLVEGTRATVTGRPAGSTNDGIDWHRIETAGGHKGWVAGQYLKIDSETTFAVGSVVEVATDFLNLRATAGLSGTVRGVLTQGDRGIVVSGPVSKNGYAWYRLDTDADGDADGWVVGPYLAKASGGFKVGDAVRVGDGPLNVRAAAGLNARVIARVSEGALFQVRGGPTVKDGYTWMRVFNYGAGTGWIAAEFLILEPDGFPLEGP